MKFLTSKFSITAAAFLSAALLAGCGGGGGGTADTSTTATFPIQKAVSNIYAKGYQKAFSVTGTATANGISIPFSGSLQVSESLVNANTTFNGQPAQEEAVSATGTVTIGGQTFDLANFAQSDLYLSPSNAVLGVTTPNSYCVAQTSGQYPASATVGESGTIGAVSCYTDSTKATLTGSGTLSYAVTAGTSAGTATVTLTSATFNPANQQVGSTQVSYIVDTSGNFTVASSVYNVSANGVQITFTAQ